MMPEHSVYADVAVIGSGLAGLAAALFAADRGLSVALVGESGATDFSSGLMDVLGAFPGEDPREDPWRALEELKARYPRHPLGAAGVDAASRALSRFRDVLAEQAVAYTGHGEGNTLVPTQLGTVRPTYRVPATVWPGVEAWAANSPCLVLDFQGMKDFDAQGMIAALGRSWSSARSDRLPCPDRWAGRETRPLPLARSLENERVLAELAESVSSRLQPKEPVGLPAVLGVHRPDRIRGRLEEMLGSPVFEIPFLPNSVPGTRIREALRDYFSRGSAVRFLAPGRVLRATVRGEHDFRLEVGAGETERMLHAPSVVLASGRFLGRGLQGERKGVREPLFGLPVAQPETREAWHNVDLFHPRGHGLDAAGIETDAGFRPVDETGRVVHQGLFAVGSLLAHADWMRFKCGAGLCLASAWRAAEGAAHWVERTE